MNPVVITLLIIALVVIGALVALYFIGKTGEKASRVRSSNESSFSNSFNSCYR